MTTRQASWSSIGKDVSECRDMRQVIELSHLDYTVEKVPIQTIRGEKIEGQVATMAEGRCYGIVSDRYGIVQNREAFDFVDTMGDELQFEKAGETASGMACVIAKLPDVDVLGDRFTPHVIFRNGFNGKFSVAAAICPLRIICQNQFSVAFKESPNTVQIRHTINVTERLDEAQRVLRAASDHMRWMTGMAEGLARKVVSPNQVQRVVEALFPMKDDASLRVRNMAGKSRDTFMNAYYADDNGNFVGTAWGLVNAYSDYVTHAEPRGQKRERFENRFVKVTFDTPINRVIEVIERNTNLALAA